MLIEKNDMKPKLADGLGRRPRVHTLDTAILNGYVYTTRPDLCRYLYPELM